MLFQGGYATPLLLARWRSKGAARGLQPNLRLTVDGKPTEAFHRIWNVAFPDRDSLPNEVLHDQSGKPTVSFIRVFH